jgi:hypothetical protein
MYRPLREQGVEIMRREDLRKVGIAWGHVKGLPVECPYQGESETLSFSNTLVENYKRRGFTLKAMCVALASPDVQFDPENGHHIKQYALSGLIGPGADRTYPFHLGDCFRAVQIISGDETADTRWRPIGCTPRYDPTTGRPVNGQKSVVLFTGGEGRRSAGS